MGPRIRSAREAAGYSACELARRIRKHPSQISRWELGAFEPQASTIAEIARECRVTTDWLLTGEGDGPEVHAHRVTEAAAVREVAAR